MEGYVNLKIEKQPLLSSLCRCRRHGNNFETLIYKKIYWVPFSVLGKPHYTNLEVAKLYESGENLKDKLTTPYEVVQLIKTMNFKQADDVKIVNNLYSHISGINVINRKEGSCASYSGLLYYLMNNIFDIYNFCILNNQGKGHAINFIRYKDALYFYDIYSQLNEFYEMTPEENGLKIEFARSTNMFSFCLKTTDVEQYIKLIEKRNLFKNKEWFYFVAKSSTIPSIYIEHKSPDDIYIRIYQKDIVKWYLKPSVNKIKVEVLK